MFLDDGLNSIKYFKTYGTTENFLKETKSQGRKNPLLSKKNGVARLAFGRKFKSWTIKQWKQVLRNEEIKKLINRVVSKISLAVQLLQNLIQSIQKKC